MEIVRCPAPYHLHISEGVSAKFLLKKVEAEYPDDAKGAGVDGDVVFRLIVGRDGRIEEIHLRRGKAVLIEAAAKAVSRWEYAPYMPRGNAVEFETSATIQFRLPNKHQRRADTKPCKVLHGVASALHSRDCCCETGIKLTDHLCNGNIYFTPFSGFQEPCSLRTKMICPT